MLLTQRLTVANADKRTVVDAVGSYDASHKLFVVSVSTPNGKGAFDSSTSVDDALDQAVDWVRKFMGRIIDQSPVHRIPQVRLGRWNGAASLDLNGNGGVGLDEQQVAALVDPSVNAKATLQRWVRRNEITNPDLLKSWFGSGVGWDLVQRDAEHAIDQQQDYNPYHENI